MSQNALAYIDDDGLCWELIGWHQQRKRRQYLIRYTRPEIDSRHTHALVDYLWMPNELLVGFEHPHVMNISSPDNQGGPRVHLQNITQVLDMAWYCSSDPDCTAGCISPCLVARDYNWGETREKFDYFYVLLQWKDEDGVTHMTWEFAECLMRVMEENHCLSLLARWAQEIDARHDQILVNTPSHDIEKVLGKPGWQYA